MADAPKRSAKPHLLDLTLEDFKGFCLSLKEPGFRAQQIWDWIHAQRVLDPALMANLPKKLRDQLSEAYESATLELVERLDGSDGASKVLFKNAKGQIFESVILRYPGRVGLCVSSQVGCKLACSFCQTGKLGFFSHLSQAEILLQYWYADKVVKAEGRRVSHVVFMGMGEPLDNYSNAVGASQRLLDPKGFGLSKRHVTLSTSGLVPQIRSLATDSDAMLALSLHAADDALRTELMPINRKYPLSALKEALLDWQRQTERKLTIEYILIRGKNSGPKHALDLVRFLQGLSAKVNLIPFNAHPGLPYQRPDEEEILSFQQALARRSIPAPVRYSLGLEVSGACGQLAAKHQEVLFEAPLRIRARGQT